MRAGADPQPVTHRHPALGFELVAPAELEALEQSELGQMLGLTSAEGEREATLAVTVEPIEPGAVLESVVDRALARQTRLPGPSRLIDRRPERLGGLAAVRTIGCREIDDRLVTVDEWRALVGERLVTVSATCSSASYGRHVDGFVASARSIRVEAERGAPPSHPRFYPENGLLVLSDAGFDALRAVASDGSDHPPPSRELETLTAAGVLVEGRPHPLVEEALRPAIEPALELTIVRGGDRARAWVSDAGACLLLPAGNELRRLAGASGPRLPALLADLVRLAPRKTPGRREPVTLASGQLARLLAELEGHPAAASRNAELPGEARLAVAGMRGHWRVEARRPGVATGEMVEVIDAERGLWFVIPGDEVVELRPTDPGEVWSQLNQLFAS